MSVSGAPADTVPVIDVAAVGKTYPNGTQALAPMSLSVHRHEFVTLLGPSGCGKSTLLKMMAGLLAPSEGHLKTAGGRVGFVFQDATLMPWASVGANVRLPLDLESTGGDGADIRVEQALASVGLAGIARNRPRELSGGMRMRVSIARALVNDPELLLMDEPFGALDEISRNRLDADLIRLWGERNLTVVFVTHSIYEAAFLSTRVLVMSAHPGRIAGELVIDEPQPRRESFRSSTRFAYCCRQLTALLAAAGAA